ncbi:MAG: hypothetical protein V4615_17240, partial [Bacteroidota bacterium]
MDCNCLPPSNFSGIKNSLRAKSLFALLVTMLVSGNIFSQLIIDTSGLKANFGVDADVYANKLEFGIDTNLTPQLGTDDWFPKSPGTGRGVIDTTGATALRNFLSTTNRAGRNRTFTRNQSVPPNTIVGNYLWIDARYVRDNHTAAEPDSTVFGGTADASSDNPNTWETKIGSTPQKDDFIDVYAHARRDLTNDSLWVFLGASLRDVGGSAYSDYEFFRSTNIVYTPGQPLAGTGTDSGHTAWKFNATGAATTIGDIIISTNYDGGGNNYNAYARIWVHLDSIPGGMPTTLFNNYNALPGIKFKLTGIFNQGLN